MAAEMSVRRSKREFYWAAEEVGANPTRLLRSLKTRYNDRHLFSVEPETSVRVGLFLQPDRAGFGLNTPIPVAAAAPSVHWSARQLRPLPSLPLTCPTYRLFGIRSLPSVGLWCCLCAVDLHLPVVRDFTSSPPVAANLTDLFCSVLRSSLCQQKVQKTFSQTVQHHQRLHNTGL